MKFYLDDDSAAMLLARLLQQAGHDIQVPADVGLSGEDDAVHLTHAVKHDRILLTGNHRDFLNLHNLVMQVSGHHPGIFVVRQENDPTRDMTPKGIVAAVRKLEAAGVPIHNEFTVLNQWR